MYAPRVFVSMIAVLLVFATATYLMTGSLFTALIEAVVCAVILQVGYFIGVLYLVHREKAGADADRSQNSRSSRQASDDAVDEIRAETARVPIRD
jgi:exopolysaccharide production repressor protein